MISKSLLALAFGALVMTPAHAQDSAQDTVVKLFDGMRAGDGDAIRALVLPEARLDRLKADGTLHQSTFERWASWVDTLESGQADEQIFGVKTVAYSKELATVWAPFVVSLDGEVKGCGVNQFTLAHTAEGWRILYGIDKPTDEDCTAFRARMSADQSTQ